MEQWRRYMYIHCTYRERDGAVEEEALYPRHLVGGKKGTPGNYCLRMRVIKRLLLCNTTAVTNLMG